MHQPNPDECPQERAVAAAGNDADAAGPRGARPLSLVFSVLLLGFLTLTLLLLLLHFVSYAKAKAFFDSYVAVHSAQGHRASYLKEEQHKDLFGRLPLGAVVFGDLRGHARTIQAQLGVLLTGYSIGMEGNSPISARSIPQRRRDRPGDRYCFQCVCSRHFSARVAPGPGSPL
jgi:hypothetical protein